MPGQLGELIASRRDAAISLLIELVAVDTSNPPGRGCTEATAVIRRALEARGISSSAIEVSEAPAEYPRTIVRAEIGDGPECFYLHGHYDVVPAVGAGQFAPRQDGGRVSGRGSSDMKSGLVAMILAAESLAAAAALDGRLVMHFVPDEETGGRFGAAQLAARGLIEPGGRGMLLPEPTSGLIWHAHRGALSIMVRVRGRTAHVGLPEEGINAVEAALPLLQAAADLRAHVESRTTSAPTGELARAHGAVVVGGRVEGPSAANAVPAEFAFSIDIRFNPDESLARLEQHVEQLLERAAEGAAEYELDVFQRASPSIADPEGRLGRALANQIERVSGKPARFELCPGVLESRFYNACDIPAFAYGPGILSLSHGPDEYVDIDEMLRCAEVFAEVIKEIMAADPPAPAS